MRPGDAVTVEEGKELAEDVEEGPAGQDADALAGLHRLAGDGAPVDHSDQVQPHALAFRQALPRKGFIELDGSAIHLEARRQGQDERRRLNTLPGLQSDTVHPKCLARLCEVMAAPKWPSVPRYFTPSYPGLIYRYPALPRYYLVPRGSGQDKGGEDRKLVFGVDRPALDSGAHGEAEDRDGLGEREGLAVLLWVAAKETWDQIPTIKTGHPLSLTERILATLTHIFWVLTTTHQALRRAALEDAQQVSAT